MLYLNGKKADRLQNCLHAFYFECKNIKETIDQYELLLGIMNDDLDEVMDKYPKLYSCSIESMRYRIIIGLGNILDTNNASLSINKILNLAEQVDIKQVNLIVKNERNNFLKYKDLINNINLLRDRMFAHIDINYSLEKEEIFDIDFEFLNKQITDAKGLIKYMMKICVEISKEYDGDSIHLSTNWLFDKQKN